MARSECIKWNVLLIRRLHFCQKEIIFRPDLAKLLPSPKKLIENLQDNQSCFVCVDSEIFAKANDIKNLIHLKIC